MAEGSKWTPGKVVLLVVGILVALTVLCCGGVFLLWGKPIVGTIRFGLDMKTLVDRLHADFGPSTRFGIKDVDQELVVLIGVDGDLSPARVREVQDKAWKDVSETFQEHGFLPVKRLAVGRAPSGSGRHQITDWDANAVTVEELVKRTGAAAPKKAEFLPKDMDKSHIDMTVDEGGHEKVNVTTDDDEEKPKEKKGDAPGGK